MPHAIRNWIILGSMVAVGVTASYGIDHLVRNPLAATLVLLLGLSLATQSVPFSLTVDAMRGSRHPVVEFLREYIQLATAISILTAFYYLVLESNHVFAFLIIFAAFYVVDTVTGWAIRRARRRSRKARLAERAV